jgi:hypothetical protein
MKMQKVLGAAAMAALLAGPALAAQNVANTSQKGSLLIWPLVTVDPNEGRQQSTLIEISNDAAATVHVECEYINERKARVNFDFDLTGKQTASWDVYTRKGDQVTPPLFPLGTGNPPFPGNIYRGELVCFATNPGREFQIAWNHLTGTAIVRSGDEAGKYNAWAFAARNAGGVAAPNLVTQSHGRPGVLRLTGANIDGVYDACPAYNIANFMPNGAELGGITAVRNDLAVVSCWQDLRERYRINTTKLEFTIWNSLEHSFTGTHYCADSITSLRLSPYTPYLVNGDNFEYDVLRTPNARFQVRGVKASPPCPDGTITSGLLGVLLTQLDTSDSEGTEATVGNTLHGAGAYPGMVVWDPSGSVPLKAQ